MFDVITIGGATRDITFVTDQGRVIETPDNLTEQKLLGFEYGAKIRSDEVRMNFGGGACNAAATFSRMGLSTAVCTGIGGDENGKSILNNLRVEGVDTRLVQVNEKQNSGFSFVVVNSQGGGERVIFVHKGASSDLEIKGEEITETGWVYLSALSGGWEDDLANIVEAVEGSAAHLAWNPGQLEIAAGKAKLTRALYSADLFIINKDEAIELVKSDPETKLGAAELNDPARLLAVIKSWGPKVVVITDGKSGVILSTGELILKAPALLEAQVDTTGAGDAFGSGFLAGYILSGDIETALRFGVLNSSGTVTRYGAQNGILTRQETEARLDAVAVEKLAPAA